MRRIWILVTGLSLLGASSLARAQTPTPTTWQAEVQTFLDQRAGAVEKGNLQAFLGTMRGAPAPFVKQRRDWFTRIRTLPLGTYELRLDQDEFGDLARNKDRRRWGNDTHVVQVKERIGFGAFDRSPAQEDLFLTIRRDALGWAVVSDTDAEDLALQSMRNLWDFGSVQTVSRNRILVVVHPAQRSVAASILSAAERARATAKSRWPYPWNDPIIVMIPSTVSELARILQTQFDLSTFVAFASSSLDRAKGWSLTGDRVFLHWPNFRSYGDGFQQIILAHEFTHLATRATTGPFEPAFMDEGIAQFYGENAGSQAQPLTRRRVRSNRFDGLLPEDWFFTAGPDDDIYLAYEESNSFMAFLAAGYGRNAGARAYLAIAAIPPLSPGLWRYHLDRAFRQTFRTPFAELERRWAAKTRRDLR